MQTLYIPITQNFHGQAKVIPMNASPLNDWISLEDAAKLFTSTKHPDGIKPETLKKKVWKRNGKSQLPAGSFVWSPTGWRFHKPTLLGLKSIVLLNPAA